MDLDFATGCPLVRPYLPQIRFRFVGSRFRSTLPSDGPSRFRPCASLVLHLHQVVRGTFTPKLLGMPSTQPLSRGPSALLDRPCARRPAERQVGTAGWSALDRTSGWIMRRGCPVGDGGSDSRAG